MDEAEADGARADAEARLDDISLDTGLMRGEILDLYRAHAVMCDCALCGAVDVYRRDSERGRRLELAKTRG